MLNAVLVIVGAVLAWLAVDRLLWFRAERLRQGRAVWLDGDADRTFHSTGWEETVSTLDAVEPVMDPPRPRRRAESRSAVRAGA